MSPENLDALLMIEVLHALFGKGFHHSRADAEHRSGGDRAGAFRDEDDTGRLRVPALKSNVRQREAEVLQLIT
jgi:hypothetical protein